MTKIMKFKTGFSYPISEHNVYVITKRNLILTLTNWFLILICTNRDANSRSSLYAFLSGMLR